MRVIVAFLLAGPQSLSFLDPGGVETKTLGHSCTRRSLSKETLVITNFELPILSIIAL